MKEVAVGIDIGGTNTVFGIVDRKGKCISKNKINTTDYEEASDMISALSKEIDALIANSKYYIIGIGVGAPNGNYFRGTIEHAPNLKWKGIIPLKTLLQKHFRVPVLVTNDANAAAIGEMMYGGAKSMKDFIVITLGTGLGSGFVVGGQLLNGHGGFAGELGHTIAVVNGRLCGCGRRGCLETYVSATGISRTITEMLENSKLPSILRNYSERPINSKLIYEAALQNDLLAGEAFEFTGKMLGLKLADTVAITNPEAIFLFGGLAHAGDLIFKPVQKSMNENLLNIFKNSVRLFPSKIHGDNAPVLGASALVWEYLDMQK